MCTIDDHEREAIRRRNRESKQRSRARHAQPYSSEFAPGQSRRWDKPYRVLTDEQVADILARSAAGESYRQIALAFDVDPSHVSRIVRGERRKAVRGER